MFYRTSKRLGSLLCALTLLTACGDDAADSSGAMDANTTTNPSGKATGEGPCDDGSECAGGVCVGLIDGDNPPVYCSQQCGECPTGFYCDQETLALLGLTFCRFGTTAMDAMPPAEPPRVPCTDDEDCEGEAVCAERNGERDCAPVCTAEDNCTVSVGGLTLDLATCAADQRSDVSRMVCVGDSRCYPNIQSCVDTGGLPIAP